MNKNNSSAIALAPLGLFFQLNAGLTVKAKFKSVTLTASETLSERLVSYLSHRLHHFVLSVNWLAKNMLHITLVIVLHSNMAPCRV